MLSYFALLGLAFTFVEIAFIQRFMLYLGHPLYAVAWCWLASSSSPGWAAV